MELPQVSVLCVPPGAVGLRTSAAVVTEPLAVHTAAAAERFVSASAVPYTLGLAFWLLGFFCPRSVTRSDGVEVGLVAILNFIGKCSSCWDMGP